MDPSSAMAAAGGQVRFRWACQAAGFSTARSTLMAQCGISSLVRHHMGMTENVADKVRCHVTRLAEQADEYYSYRSHQRATEAMKAALSPSGYSSRSGQCAEGAPASSRSAACPAGRRPGELPPAQARVQERWR